MSFNAQVYAEIKINVKDAVIALVRFIYLFFKKVFHGGYSDDIDLVVSMSV